MVIFFDCKKIPTKIRFLSFDDIMFTFISNVMPHHITTQHGMQSHDFITTNRAVISLVLLEL